MRPGAGIRAATVLLASAALPCAAQRIPPPQPWHLKGSVGFSLSNSTNRQFRPLTGTDAESDQSTLAGDLRLALDGYLKDPRLLLFNLNFDGQRGSNDIEAGGFRNTLLGWSANTVFLPQRPFPLRFYYRNNNFASRGNGFGQDADNSALGVEWTLRLPQAPRLNIGFNRFTNDVRLATSLADASFRQQAWTFSADDDWKQWQWGVAFQDSSSDSTTVGGIVLPNGFQQDLRVLSARLRRPLWGRKAEFTLENRNQWRDSAFPDQTATDSTENYLLSSLRIRHTEKLSSSYSYTYVRVRFRSTSVLESAPGLLGNIFQIEPTTFSSHSGSGRVDYQFTNSLRLSQEVRYNDLTPPSNGFEARDSLTESLSSVTFQRLWRGFDVGAGYTGHYQLVGSNFGNRADSFSNDLDLRVGWGDARRLRLRGSALYSKFNLVEQLGGFSDQRKLRIEALTAALPQIRLRLHAERSRVELVNLSGDTRRHHTGFGLQLDHRRFSLSAARTLEEGAGALFPTPVQSRFLLIIQLPLDELIATPLLNRTTRATSANLVLRLRRNLDLRANWRRESSLLPNSDLTFGQAEVYARYRLAKFSFEGGYGNYRSDTLAALGLSGTEINRYYLRIVRDFQVF